MTAPTRRGPGSTPDLDSDLDPAVDLVTGEDTGPAIAGEVTDTGAVYCPQGHPLCCPGVHECSICANDRTFTAHEGGGCCDRDVCPTCGRSFDDGVGWLQVHRPGPQHLPPLSDRCCLTKPEYVRWRNRGAGR